MAKILLLITFFFFAKSQIELTVKDSLLGVIGGEDITIDYETGYAYISSLDRRTFFKQKKLINGNIYIYNFNNPEAIPRPITLNINFNFQPHGIFLLQKDGEKYLFVINHYSHKKSKIERFRIQGQELFWETSYENEEFYSPNDIYAIDKDKFFITNDQKSRSFFFKLLEGTLKLKTGNIVYYDGKNATVIYKKLGFPNGIQKFNDTLFVATSLEKSLYIFQINEDKSLSKIKKVKLNSALDNLEWDNNGNLWIVGHSKISKFTLNSLNPEKKSPWDIFLIKKEYINNISKDNVIKYHFGKKQQRKIPFSTASVIAVYGNFALIGSVFEPYILLVEIHF